MRRPSTSRAWSSVPSQLRAEGGEGLRGRLVALREQAAARLRLELVADLLERLKIATRPD